MRSTTPHFVDPHLVLHCKFSSDNLGPTAIGVGRLMMDWREHFAVCIHHPVKCIKGVLHSAGKIGPPHNEVVNGINWLGIARGASGERASGVRASTVRMCGERAGGFVQILVRLKSLRQSNLGSMSIVACFQESMARSVKRASHLFASSKRGCNISLLFPLFLACRNAALQFFTPVENNVDLGGRCISHLAGFEHQEALAVA